MVNNWQCNGLIPAKKVSRRDPGVFDSGVRTEDGDTLGHTAIRRGVREHVETLAAQERCDCWNVPDRWGETPIMLAARKDAIKIVEILLRCPRVDLNCRNMIGETPIMWAMSEGKTEIVEILLRCPRVDLSCRDREGWSLLFRLIQKNRLGEKISKSWVDKIL